MRKDRHDEDVVVDVLGLASEAIETSNEYPYPQRRYKGIAAQNRFGLCGCFSCAGEQTCFTGASSTLVCDWRILHAQAISLVFGLPS